MHFHRTPGFCLCGPCLFDEVEIWNLQLPVIGDVSTQKLASAKLATVTYALLSCELTLILVWGCRGNDFGWQRYGHIDHIGHLAFEAGRQRVWYRSILARVCCGVENDTEVRCHTVSLIKIKSFMGERAISVRLLELSEYIYSSSSMCTWMFVGEERRHAN